MWDSTATEKSQLDQLDQLDPDSPPSAPRWWRDGGGAEKTRQSFSWSPLERGRGATDKPAACLRGAGGGKRGWRLGVADGCETPSRKSIGPHAARPAALASWGRRTAGSSLPGLGLCQPPAPTLPRLADPAGGPCFSPAGHRQSHRQAPAEPCGEHFTCLATLSFNR